MRTNAHVSAPKARRSGGPGPVGGWSRTAARRPRREPRPAPGGRRGGLDAAPAAIAKRAGVGVGTLYRHFPTREALIDAACRHQLAVVCEQASSLLAHPRLCQREARDVGGVSELLSAGAEDATLRDDVPAEDGLVLIGGMALPRPPTRSNTRR
ncbi:TetR/AcrR family transcriptional regulator [Amycolatopsis sp. M39]|uniref:TetR/AcrR family transcriptional regulator n=1 Tax=Amycolatopsis TaxID=1813 RepID=UPI0018E30B02|nr:MULTISPECIES: TetR/AcrR family transcriptional regulator [Amycolatopsis]